jgi:CheY-like chemotaxis protein
MPISHSDQHSMQILIAEDDHDIATLYKKALERRGHNVTITSNGETCLKRYLDVLHQTTFGVSSSASSMSETTTTTTTATATATATATSAATTTTAATTTNQDPSLSTGPVVFRTVSKAAPYDVVILDYSMPSINGMDAAKEILTINSHQRVIFASAYVKETLERSVKELKQVVELIQKPFSLSELIDIIEDREIYEDLRTLNIDIELVKAANPTHEQILDLLERLKRIQKHERLKRIQKHRTF